MIIVAIGDKGNFRYDERHVVSCVCFKLLKTSSKWIWGESVEGCQRRASEVKEVLGFHRRLCISFVHNSPGHEMTLHKCGVNAINTPMSCSIDTPLLPLAGYRRRRYPFFLYA